MGITLQKIAGAILFALIVVVSINLVVDGLMPAPQSPQSPQVTASEAGVKATPGTPPPAAAGGAPAGAEHPLAQRLAAADPKKGEAIAKKCQSCHTSDKGGPIKVGPNLYDVVGRRKGSFPGFPYSEALEKMGGTWTYEDLDKFLAKPGAFAPGTRMTFPGLPSGDDRANVIAYLRSISPDAPPP